MIFGVSSMTAPLRQVAVRRPGPSMVNADPSVWHYGPPFDRTRVSAQHDNFTSCLADAGCDVIWMDNDDQGIADAVFTYDASLVTPRGAILMSPGKALRNGEQDTHRAFFDSIGIPIGGEITGDARAEAGDTLWLDDTLLAIGRGFRTNAAGVSQITDLLKGMGVTAQAFDLPYYQGQDACLHLMSLVSIVDTRTALVCLDLVPVALRQLMLDLGYRLIAAPFDEFQSTGTLSTNVLATAPGRCIMLDGIPKTRAALENAGIEVTVFEGDALCIGCEGGPTCLTRPLLRKA
ncbi:MAG: amidinotransferase [Rhizobiaceae bacterium]|nr:amidinotransferase [Rhizobiaceae bacterium]